MPASCLVCAGLWLDIVKHIGRPLPTVQVCDLLGRLVATDTLNISVLHALRLKAFRHTAYILAPVSTASALDVYAASDCEFAAETAVHVTNPLTHNKTRSPSPLSNVSATQQPVLLTGWHAYRPLGSLRKMPQQF